MTPVAKVATGFVFAFGAVRFNGFDLLLDPVGWGLCASGLQSLRRAPDDLFVKAEYAAVAMTCVSVFTVLFP